MSAGCLFPDIVCESPYQILRIPKTMLLQSPNCRQKLGDDSHFFGFQKCAESANDTEPVIFGEIPAQSLIYQNQVRLVSQRFGYCIPLAGIQCQKSPIRLLGIIHQAYPVQFHQIRNHDRKACLAFSLDGFNDMEFAMDSLKDVKPLNGREGQKRGRVAVYFHSAVSRS